MAQEGSLMSGRILGARQEGGRGGLAVGLPGPSFDAEHCARVDCPVGRSRPPFSDCADPTTVSQSVSMKTFSPRPRDIERRWYVIDAEGAVLGRLASEVAKLLRGKH